MHCTVQSVCGTEAQNKEVIFTSLLNLLCRGPSLGHGQKNKFRCDITAPVRWVCQTQSQKWIMKPDTSLSWVWFGSCIQWTVKYNVLKPEQCNDPSLYCILSNGSVDSEWWTENDVMEPFGSSCVVIILAFVANGWGFHLFTQGSTDLSKI